MTEDNNINDKVQEMAAFAADMAKEAANIATEMSKEPTPNESTIKIKAVSERQELAAATARTTADRKASAADASAAAQKAAEKKTAAESKAAAEKKTVSDRRTSSVPAASQSGDIGKDQERIRQVKLENAKSKARTKHGRRKRAGVGIISSLLFIVAVLCAVYGVFVVLIIGKGHWFNFVWLIGAGILLIFSFLISNHSRLPKFLKAMLFLALLAVAANFGVFLYRDISFAAAGPGPQTKWVIILGAKVEGNAPSVEFQARIEKAAEYVRSADFERNDPKKENVPPLITFVTTGAQGTDETAAEGDVAARILRSMGFDESRILTETRSTTTQENLQYARELIAANGGTVYDDIVIVTSAFHLYRAVRIAQDVGFVNISGLGSRGLAILLPHYYFREYAAIMKEVYNTRFAK